MTRRVGSWRASSISRSPCTSRWVVWPAGSAWSSSSATWGCSGPTRRTCTAATSATRSGRWSRDSGGKISIAPQVEVQMGHGWPPVLKAIEYGPAPELLDRCRDDRAGRHVHPDARRRSAPSGAGSTRRAYEPNEQVPKDCLTARADAAGGDASTAPTSAGRRGPDRIADAGQAGRRRDPRRQRRSTWLRSSTPSPPSCCAPMSPTSTP